MLESLLIAGAFLLLIQLPFAMLVGRLLKNGREWEDAQMNFLEHPDVS